MNEPAAETDFERTRRLRREASARYRAKNLEKRRAWTREYMARKREEDPAWVKANNDRYLKKYPERLKTRKHAYYEKNKANWAPFLERYRRENPEKCRAAIKAWQDRNPAKVRASQNKSKARPEAKARNSARQMRRHATKLNATPPWADHAAIQEIYDFANFMTRTTGEKWEVDHIYPLISKTICGLHCEFNLQVITKSMNARKSNKWNHP